MAIAGLMISLISNELTSNSQSIREAQLMDKQKDNQSELNEEAFERQSEFWQQNQSPNALMKQYTGLGASETAALQSILGITPASVPTASSGSAAGGSASAFSTLPQMLEALQSSYNSQFTNANTAAQTENIMLQNKWLPIMYQSTLDSMYGHLQLDFDKLGLDRDIFEKVTLPVANSTLNLNQSQIEVNRQKVHNLCAERLKILQEIDTLKAQETNQFAQAGLAGAQTGLTIQQTELTKQQTLNEEQTTQLKQYENRLKAIDVELSEFTGSNLTLPWQNIGIESGVKTVMNAQTKATHLFEKACDAAYNEANKVLQLRGKAYRAYKKQSEFFKNYKEKSDRRFHSAREKAEKRVYDWIDSWNGYDPFPQPWSEKW